MFKAFFSSVFCLIAVLFLAASHAADDKDTLTMPTAQRFDPDKIAEWSASIPKDKEIVLFCAHGRSISDASVKYLHANGFKARLIPGGFDAWKEAGGITVAKP
jgi:rhodanese-related sulfurtransferase